LKVEFVKRGCLVKDMKNNYNFIAQGIQEGGLNNIHSFGGIHQDLLAKLIQNFKDIVMLQKNNMVKGFILLKSELVGCEICSLGKGHKVDFSKLSEIEKREMLELVHTDLCESIQTKYLSGASYFMIFIDDKTRYT
jgi:hypothetical protein